MTDRIKPRTLKGFRDFAPEKMLPREQVIETAKAVYRSFGFSPIDTPALEYTEILLGKGGDESDKQLYRFEDAGGRDVALRFDLTVPLARFVAQHVGQLGMPFKRYHVGPVWRGENTQRGRYREFVQCDFDTIGTTSILSDIETALVIHDLFKALGFEAFTIRINNRRVLSGLLDSVGLAGSAAAVLRAVDKLPKVGEAAVREELASLEGADANGVEAVLSFIGLEGPGDEVLAAMAETVAGSDEALAGVAELAAVLDGVQRAGVSWDRIAVDPSIARGLDYYTGTVFETFLDELPDIGSCCSGGRYDDLASVYTKQRLPGVGASLGLDRLLAAMEELDMLEGRAASAPILVTVFDHEHSGDALEVAAELRSSGLGVELYPGPRKLGAQLKYADRKGHAVVVIVGPDEVADSVVQIKQMATGQSESIPRGDAAARCRALIETES